MKGIKIFAFVLSAMMLGSCTDFLDLDPKTAQTEENFFQDRKDAFAALMGIYEPLRSDFGQSYHPYAMVSDIMSDDVYPGGGGSADMLTWQNVARFKAQPQEDTPLAMWKKGYRGVGRANQLLAKFDQIQFKTSEQEDAENFKGEALFLRGHYYFELARFYGNIPLSLEPLAADNWQGVELTSADEVYAQIAADMLAAIPMMRDSRFGDTQLGRLTKWAAMSEMVKVFQYYTGYYNKTELPVAGGGSFTLTDAIEMAESVVNESGHTLLEDYATLFTAEGDFSSEVIFEIPFTSSGSGEWNDTKLGNIQCQMSGPRGHNGNMLLQGWGFGIPTHSLYAEFEAGDERLTASIITGEQLLNDTPNLEASYTNTGYFTFKYTTHINRQAESNPDLNWPQNYHYIRLADVMLMAAELNLKAGNTAAAVDQVNMVRSRAGLADVSSVDLDGIYHERRVELALEGHRYWDLLRRGVDYAKSQIDVTNYEMRAPSIAGKPATGDVGSPSDFEVNFDAAKKGLFPIPQSERDLNPNLKQNDGY
ncbi:RagB/SusD family nutrient uptake outer membrane protein [Limibacter armeniacum]|uniref:RagB/SusD family nutrient uptake outer membrane protein n=1 Tax=Limibacter armeniacum TaxID=466084 RepID=UPI002FE68F3A